MKLKSLLLFLVASAGLLMGSEAKPALVFEAKETKSFVTIPLGQELKIMLPTTDAGHVWQIVANDRRYLRATSRITALPGDATAGATISFQTNRNGHTRLSFAYVKPTESEAATPAETRDIQVTIGTP